MRGNLQKRKRKMSLYSLFILNVLCFFSMSLEAGRIQVELSPEGGSPYDEYIFKVELEGDLAGEIDFPHVDGIQVVGRNVSHQTSIINFDMTVTKIYSFQLQISRPGEYTIPPIKAKIDDKWQQSRAIRFKVSTNQRVAPGSPKGLPLAFVQRKIAKRKVYLGEAIPANIDLYYRMSNPRLQETRFDPPPSLRFLKAKEKQGVVDIKGQRFQIFSLQQVFIPQSSGQIIIPSYVIILQWTEKNRKRQRRRDPFDMFDDFFGSNFQRPVSKAFASSEDKLEVLPIPTQGRPSDYSGLVGQFKLESSLSETSLLQGDSLTLTLTISGNGQLDSMKPLKLNLPPHFKVYPDQPSNKESISAEGIRSERIYKYALVATSAGQFDLGSLKLAFFEPNKEKFLFSKVHLGEIKVKKDLTTLGSQKQKPTNIPLRNSQSSVESKAQDLIDIHRFISRDQSHNLSSQIVLKGLLFFGAFFVFFCLCYFFWFFSLRKSGDDKRRLKILAYKNFKKRIWSLGIKFKQASPNISLKELSQFYLFYRQFLGHKLQIHGGALTLKEVSEKFELAGLSKEIRKEALEVARKMDSLDYGSQEFSAEEKASLQSKIYQLVEEIEKQC